MADTSLNIVLNVDGRAALVTLGNVQQGVSGVATEAQGLEGVSTAVGAVGVEGQKAALGVQAFGASTASTATEQGRLRLELQQNSAALSRLGKLYASAETDASRGRVERLTGAYLQQRDALQESQRGLKQFGTDSGVAQQAVFGLAATLDDAQQFQFGFAQGMRAITNNFQPLFQGFVSMRTQAAASGVSLASTLGAALTGPAGILVGMTLVAAVAPKIGEALDDAFESAEEKALAAAVSVDELLDVVSTTAEQYESAVDAVLHFEQSVDEFTISTEEQAEALAAVYVQDVAVAKAKVEATKAQIAQTLAAGGWGAQARENDRILVSLQERLKGQQDDLILLTSLLDSTRDAQVRFNAEQRAAANVRARNPNLQTDADRESAERATRDAERAAERAQKKQDRDAATATRRAEREAVRAGKRADTDAQRRAEERTRLELALRIELATEGTSRSVEQARQEFAGRLKIAEGSEALIQSVRLAHARELAQIDEREIREREDRLLTSLDRVRQAREAADRASGVLDETIAQERFDQIRAEAAERVQLIADRAAADGKAIADQEKLVEAIQHGTSAQAEQLAVRVAEHPELQTVLDLMLERLGIEAQLGGLVRSRAEEERRADRAALRTEDELEARRKRANDRVANPGAAPDPTADADARIERLNLALGDLDAEIARVSGTAVAEAADVVAAVTSAVGSGADAEAQVVVNGARFTVGELRRLAEERKALSGEVAEAEVAAGEVAADAIVESYRERTAAARQAAERTIDAVERAFGRQRKFTELDKDVAKARFAEETRELERQLRSREISQREYSLEIRKLRQDESEFNRAVAQDEKTIGDALLADSLRFSKEVAKGVISAEIAKGTTGYFADVLKFFGFLGPFAPAAAAATVPAMLAIFKGIIPGFATGGPIHGRGTGTSDDVLAWLSNGEHVITAAAATGQHDALRSLDGMMRGGLDLRNLLAAVTAPRFAVGGQVFARPVPAPVISVTQAGATDSSAAVVAELRATRQQLAQQGREIARLAVPRVLTDPEARRATRRAAREQRLKQR